MFRFASFGFVGACAVLLALAGPAFAQDGEDDEDLFPETIQVRDFFAEGGVREMKPDWDEINKHPLGSAQNPVRCDRPQGERAYLARLRCPSGSAPRFSRDGSVGLGPYMAIMDVYSVVCPPEDKLGDRVAVFMDMYHPGYVERRPVPGFKIVAPPRIVRKPRKGKGSDH